MASSNPRCSLVSRSRVSHHGSLTDKVAARWSIVPEMVLLGSPIPFGDYLLMFAPQEHALHCPHCKVKGHDAPRCPFTPPTTAPPKVSRQKGGFSSPAELFSSIRGRPQGPSTDTGQHPNSSPATPPGTCPPMVGSGQCGDPPPPSPSASQKEGVAPSSLYPLPRRWHSL